MCIIVAIKPKEKITKEIIQRCWTNNPHGGGFMYNVKGKIFIYKELSSFKKYWKAFSKARARHSGASFVLHFRISTHGKVDYANIHPFFINTTTAFCHNGIISAAPISAEFSDTYMFNETILKNLPDNWVNDETQNLLVSNYVGAGSKLTFLKSDGEIYFLNEKGGIWEGGIWYSNVGYKKRDYINYGGLVKSALTSASSMYAAKNNEFSFGGYGDKYDTYEAGYGGNYRSSYKNDYHKEMYGGDSVNLDTCEYCTLSLNSTSEIMNKVCNKCHNKIIEDDNKIWRDAQGLNQENV